MIETNTAMWICLAFIVYYAAFQVFSDFIRSGMTTNTRNRTIAELRTNHGVNIKTFNKNNNLQAFAWFNTIFINEEMFKHKEFMIFAFHHEYYHLKHNHKALILLMRLILSLMPILLIFLYWWIWVVLFFGSAFLIQHIQNNFEKKANAYAYAKQRVDENIESKKSKSTK